MFALLAVLFSVASFTDPARKALTPQLVPQRELHLAATLDAFTWSLMVGWVSTLCMCNILVLSTALSASLNR